MSKQRKFSRGETLAAGDARPFLYASLLPPTIYVIDDDDAVREAIRDILEHNGRRVAIFTSGEAFLDAYIPGGKACLLVDAHLPGIDGIALLERIDAERWDLPSIMITGHADVTMAVSAMKTGAVDFIEKPVDFAKLLASIDRALQLFETPSTSSAQRDLAKGLIAALTPRQRQIMEMVIVGHPNKVIAAKLNVSQRTVETHRAAIMRKTGSKSLSDLIRFAIAAT
jgi:two-component system CheB/CheR fusion protein